MPNSDLSRRIERLEAAQPTGPAVFVHVTEPPDTPEEAQANADAERIAAEAGAAGQTVIRFRHVRREIHATLA